MHEGRIVERGTHDNLIALNGYYKRLVDMQKFWLLQRVSQRI